MNLRGGIALIKKSLYSYTSSRGFFWTLAVGWMVGPLVYLFVWSVAAGQGTIGGYNRQDFTFYYLALILVNQFTYATSHWVVGENIQIGTIATWLLRPVPVIYEAIAGDLAVKIVCMPFTLVVALVLGLVLHVQMTLTLSGIMLFVAGLLLAQVLRFMLAYTLALMAFWTQRIDSLLALNDTFIFLFAGQVAPVALLPGVIRQLATALPFRYMLGFPLELLMGKLSAREIILGFGWQVIWIVAVLLLHQVVWRAGKRQYVSIGG